jgi:hypothetical protein
MSMETPQTPVKEPRKDPSRFNKIIPILRYWELILFLAYVAGLLILVLPGLRWDFERVHTTVLLLSSNRIWAGQIPYKDFFPWYGPLYHYFLALMIRPIGNNIYAVKFFLDILCPIMCMGILIIALRKFEMPAASRLFVYLAVPMLGAERVFYSGSLRSFLPVLLIAFWRQGFKKRRALTYLMLFPGAGLLFFFSPEVGVFLALSAMVYMGMGAWSMESRAEKLRLLVWSGAGFLSSSLALIVLYWSTAWFKNMLEFLASLSQNFNWSYGLPKPGLGQALKSPQMLLFYLPAAIYLLGTILALANFLLNKARIETALWVSALAVFGALLWASSMVRVGAPHIQFGYPAAMIVASFVFTPSLRPANLWRLAGQALLIAAVISGAVFLQPKLVPPFKGKAYAMMSGVRIPVQEQATLNKFMELAANAGADRIFYPLDSVFPVFLNAAPAFPFDSLYYAHFPAYQKRYVAAMNNLHVQYLVINQQAILWDYLGEAVDTLMDFIDANYKIQVNDFPLLVYVKRDQPRIISETVGETPGPFVLDESNRYKLALEIPPGMQNDYLELEENFEFRWNFLSRFSLPIVETYTDGRRWVLIREQEGRKRIDPNPGFHRYRVYFLHKGSKLELQVTFPGAFNFRPSRIIIKDIKWRRFPAGDISPRIRNYVLQGEEGSPYPWQK